MNNKKALAKTFWNIWEWWWVGVGGIVGEWILGICLGRDGCDGDAGESEVRTI
jgi:hypothetical protein